MSKKIFEGTVTSNKMEKTVVVSVQRRFQEKRMGKIVSVRKKYKIHCEEDAVKVGDTVQFVECRPMSKYKKWRFLRTVINSEEAVELAASPAEGALS